jgi:ribosomal-protein-alanine N-acetyltransferase
VSAQRRPAAERFVPMTVADLDAVMAIEAEVYPFPWTRGNFHDSLHAGHSCWTLRDADGALAGYSIVMLALDEAHLLNLTVARPFHGSGCGWQLLDWMARRACEHGARTLLLEVRPTNGAAVRLYERYGFQRIGLRRDYYPALGGREDAWVLRITL